MQFYGQPDKDQDKVSPLAITITLLYHFLLVYLVVAQLSHHHPSKAPNETVIVSIPVDTSFHPKMAPATPLKDVLDFDIQPIDPDHSISDDPNHYYQQRELSEHTHALMPFTQSLGVPIRQVVVVSIYVNEAGDMDAITFDDPGDLTEEEKAKLVERLRIMQFLPGLRGTKIVKSIYRMQIQVNQKIIIRR